MRQNVSEVLRSTYCHDSTFPNKPPQNWGITQDMPVSGKNVFDLFPPRAKLGDDSNRRFRGVFLISGRSSIQKFLSVSINSSLFSSANRLVRVPSLPKSTIYLRGFFAKVII